MANRQSQFDGLGQGSGQQRGFYNQVIVLVTKTNTILLLDHELDQRFLEGLDLLIRKCPKFMSFGHRFSTSGECIASARQAIF